MFTFHRMKLHLCVMCISHSNECFISEELSVHSSDVQRLLRAINFETLCAGKQLVLDPDLSLWDILQSL